MFGIKRGFTLAEVLITLVIIGIIAAMTIPSLINKTNEQETVVAVKKAYSIFAQAYQKLIAVDGEIYPQNLDSDASRRSETVGEMFVKQLNVQKICGLSTNDNCFAPEVYKYFNGEDFSSFNEAANDYKFRLSDGMSVGIYMFSNYENYGDSDMLNSVIGYVYFDVNGDKKPNTLGKDTFTFWITKNGILPLGTADDNAYDFSSCYTTGHGCAAWVVTKGNMDYLHKEVSWQ